MGKTCIKFCKKCTGISPKDLKGVIDKGYWKEGCVHACVKKKDGTAMPFARIDGKLVVASSKKSLIKKMKEAVA